MPPSHEMLKRVLPCAYLSMDSKGRILEGNALAQEWTGRSLDELVGKPLIELLRDAPIELRDRLLGKIEDDTPPIDVYEYECTLEALEGPPVPVEVRLTQAPNTREFVCALSDQRTLQSLEFKLGQAQQLESVGRIAAGIAHEINTPVQFIGDSVSFLGEAFADLLQLLDRFETLHKSARSAGFEAEILASIESLSEEADLEFLRGEVPASLERTLEGVARVAEIARAIKEFSYPDQHEKEATDLNAALRNTLTIARNEYKYVAEIETDLGDLPPVFCHAGHLNQVFLNLIVNAAHAIDAKRESEETKGTIRIRTRAEGNIVSIRISDTGCGIPREIRTRVFDAFFTTKEVGRGTGQGLAIARSVIVEKHGGTLSFDSEVGEGTCFEIRLPVDGRDVDPEVSTSAGCAP